MHLVNLCVGVVVLIIFYISKIQVLSDKIDCVPVENCPFAIKILSKRYKAALSEVWDLFKMSKCGYDEETKRLKIWCTKFTNCRISDKQYGTCIPAKSCTVLAELLNINITAEVKDKLPLNEYICSSHQVPEVVHVCCPWPAESSVSEMTNKYALGNQEKTRQKRQHANTPWFAQTNGNTYFNPLQSRQNFLNLDFGSQNTNSGLPNNWFQSGENIFSQQNTNFFDKLKSSQTNSITGLQNSLAQQTKRFQSALQKRIFETNQNNNNEALNLWDWYPGGNSYDQYNLTEETSDSIQEICMTPDNFEGTCREFRQCPSIMKALSKINTTNFVQVTYLKKFRCSNTESSDPKVCCSENAIMFPSSVTSTTPSELESQERSSNSLDDISSICGRQITNDKIIGGTVTDLAEFPWTVVLQYATSKGQTFGCGGSIINNRYIVTAAHCVNVNILRQAGLKNLQQVILGEHDRRNETDCIYTPYGSDCADPTQTFGIERILEHELFRSNATPNDIALVRLDRDIVFSNYIRPICLPTIESLNLQGNETFTITGWGKTETGESSPVKRKARLPFVDKSKCGQLGPLTDGQMCLGSGKGTDSCKGDSGGPVMSNSALTSNDPVTILVGIISFGFGRCGTTTSVSTYVPHYMDWILKNIS